MNFGGPLESVCLKINIGIVTQSGVLKYLGLLQLNILHNDNHNHNYNDNLIKDEKLVVYPCCYSNDGTALKSAVEFDNTFKTNVG